MTTYSSVQSRAAGARYSWLDGLIAGAVAGLAQGMVGMLATLVMGQGLFWPLVLIGHAFRPLTQNPSQDIGTIVMGLMIHMVFTMMLGVVFALIAGSLPRALPLWVWGMLFGVLIWLVGQFVGPAVDATLFANMNQILFLITHLVFGMVLGGWLSWRGSRATA